MHLCKTELLRNLKIMPGYFILSYQCLSERLSLRTEYNATFIVMIIYVKKHHEFITPLHPFEPRHLL